MDRECHWRGRDAGIKTSLRRCWMTRATETPRGADETRISRHCLGGVGWSVTVQVVPVNAVYLLSMNKPDREADVSHPIPRFTAGKQGNRTPWM